MGVLIRKREGLFVQERGGRLFPIKGTVSERREDEEVWEDDSFGYERDFPDDHVDGRGR